MGAGDTRGQGVEKVLSGDGAIGETQGRYLILWGGRGRSLSCWGQGLKTG